jgi:hypothetical protein
MVRVRSRVRVYYTDYPPLEELDALVEQMRQSQKQEEDKVLRRYQLIRKLLGLRQMAGVCSISHLNILSHGFASQHASSTLSWQCPAHQSLISCVTSLDFPRRPQETEAPPIAREGYLSFLSFYISRHRELRQGIDQLRPQILFTATCGAASLLPLSGRHRG